MNRQIYKMTLSDASDSITFYLLEVPIADDDITGTARNTTIDGNVYEDYLWLKKQWSQKWSIMCKDEYDKLRGIWKRQYTDSEVVSVKYFYGDNIYTDGEVEGNTMQINNDSEVYEGDIRGFNLLGNTTQQTYTGKNLFDRVNASENKVLTWTNGDPNDENKSIVGDYISASEGQQFSTNYNAFIFCYDNSKTYLGTIQTGGATIAKVTGRLFSSFTIPSGYGVAYIRVEFRSNVNSNIDMTQQDIMVNIGSPVEPYEPYVGSIPSPNPEFPQAIKTVTGAQTVKITGKNIFDKDSATPINAYITINGAIGASGADRLITLPVMPNTTYTITAERIGQISGQLNDDFAGALFTSDTSPTIGSTGRRIFGTAADTYPKLNQTFTTSATENWLAIKVANVQRSDYAGSLATIQLEINDQATPFEPYQAQSYEINLGKNLCDSGIYFNANTIQLNIASGEMIPQTFTASFISDTAVSGANLGLYLNGSPVETLKTGVNILANQKTSVSATISDATYATLKRSDTMGVVLYKSGSGYDASHTLGEPMVEAGTQDTPYAPYKTPLELAEIGTYQDYIWNDGGTWKIHKAIGHKQLDVNIASLAENAIGTNEPSWKGAFCIQKTAWNYAGGDYDNDIAFARLSKNCGQYIEQDITTNYQAHSMIDGSFVQRPLPNFDRIYFRSSSLTGKTGAEVKAILQAQGGADFWYILPTPTDTEITDAELVGQLNALLAGSLYKGLNNIFLIPSAGADGTMTLDYRIDYEKETVVQDTTPVLLDLTDDGIINACQCRQNVKITMRETVQ